MDRRVNNMKMEEIEIEKLVKLPRWARDYINQLAMERETAIRNLNKYLDEQKPSPYFTEELMCTGEEKERGSAGPTNKIRYIQASGIACKHPKEKVGVRMRVVDDGIMISLEGRGPHHSIAIIPSSSNCFYVKGVR
jgi:hypothetical protein